MDKSKDESTLSPLDLNYPGNAPWAIGKPQPALSNLFDKYSLISPVLDVGCGAGDLSISIANRGHSVLGIDLSGKAIEISKSKIGTLKPELENLVEFRVGNALEPSQFNKKFGAIVDSGFYHLFDRITREKYVHELSKSLMLGGRYYLLGFAISTPIPNGPKQVTQNEIEELFSISKGWQILELKSAEFLTLLPPPRGNIPAILACIEKLAE